MEKFKKLLALMMTVIMLSACIVVPSGRVNADDSSDLVRAFVTRLYETVFDRAPDNGGLNYWANGLTSGQFTAASTVNYFFGSNEYLGKQKTSSEYINDLYRCMMDRPGDTAGINYWVGKLNSGVQKRTILAEFVKSAEFTNICSRYGITRGTVPTDYSLSRFDNVTNFINGMYTAILGRGADSWGLNNYRTKLINGSITAANLVKDLVLSAEGQRKTPTNTSFVTLMYTAIRGVNPSSSDVSAWVNRMNCGMTRNQVLSQFINTSDFQNICNRYGITRGSYNVGRIIDPTRPMIALTFDDGPATGTTRILDCLAQYGQTATFFVVGSNARNYQSTITRMAAIGCEVGNHTYNHPSLTSVSEATMVSELDQCNSYINSATGHNATVLRPPYGSYNDVLRRVAGVPLILWSVDTRDWATRSTTSTVNSVLSSARDGDIVLMHDIHASTVEAALILIPELTARGYQLVTVSELAMYRGGMNPGQVYSRIR